MKTTKLFLALATATTLLFSSCKKTETVLPQDSQIESTTDKTLGTDSWIVSKVQLRGKDIHLQPTTFLFDKNQLLVTSDEVVATSTTTILSNDEILIDGFDITQFKSKIDPTLIDLLESTSGIFKYQKNATRIVLTAPGVSIFLIQGGQKSLSVLEQHNWEVIDFKCAPKDLNFEWVNGPQMSFVGDMITTTFNGSSCNKIYDNISNTLTVKAANRNIGDRNVEVMLDIFQGDFTWTILSNGNLEIKNGQRTKLVLKPSISTTITSTNSNLTIQ
jgi:hypothetical protein